MLLLCRLVIVQLLNPVSLFATLWNVPCQAPQTISQGILELLSIELMMLLTNSSSYSPCSFDLSKHQALFQ